jgi:type IV secretion system protein TrbI
MVSDDRPKAEHEIAADLRLRPEGPPVTRLSRKVLVGVASLAIVAVLGAVIWAFDSRRDREEAGPELYNTEHKSTAEEPAKLPRDYTGVPPGVSPLGPPLPGDLGRPMLQGRGPQGGADPEPARRAGGRGSAHEPAVHLINDGQSNNAGVTGDDAERNI